MITTLTLKFKFQIWLHDGRGVVYSYPRPLSSLGLPEELTHIDAAFVWGHNNKPYLYSGMVYWRLDEDTGRVEPDYPRDMGMWRGIGYHIDTVFQWKDGKTYFFKGKGYWRFNDLRMSVEHEEQKSSAQFWMGCPRETATGIGNNTPGKDRLTADPIGKGVLHKPTSTMLTVAFVLALFMSS